MEDFLATAAAEGAVPLLSIHGFQYTFEEALETTVDWYLANGAWVDGIRSGEIRVMIEPAQVDDAPVVKLINAERIINRSPSVVVLWRAEENWRSWYISRSRSQCGWTIAFQASPPGKSWPEACAAP